MEHGKPSNVVGDCTMQNARFSKAWLGLDEPVRQHLMHLASNVMQAEHHLSTCGHWDAIEEGLRKETANDDHRPSALPTPLQKAQARYAMSKLSLQRGAYQALGVTAPALPASAIASIANESSEHAIAIQVHWSKLSRRPIDSADGQLFSTLATICDAAMSAANERARWVAQSPR